MSQETTDQSRRYTNNRVRLFVLRFDLAPEGEFNPEAIIKILPHFYDRLEQRTISGIRFDIGPKPPQMTEQKGTDYLLISDKISATVTFSQSQRFISIEMTRYSDYSSYRETLLFIEKALTDLGTNVAAIRIGMRFINEFPCTKSTEIRRILAKPYAAAAANLLVIPGTSRAIALIETNAPTHRSRIQFGVPNKFYPAIIQVPDITLDIDVFTEGATNIAEWSNTAKMLNHSAYSSFTEVVSENYRETLK